MALGGILGPRNPAKLLHGRIIVAVWLVGAAFLVLTSRLYALQILRGEELTKEGEENLVQYIRIPHDRGIIYDRLRRILADNRQSLDVQVIPAFLGDAAHRAVTLGELARLIDLSFEESESIRNTVESQIGLDRFQPIVVKRDLSAEQVESIESERSVFRLDGVNIVEGRRRDFPNGKLASHLLGYVKEIDAVQLDAERVRCVEGEGGRKVCNPRKYVLGDLFGRDGIERMQEAELRGEDGFEKTVVDAKGRQQPEEYIRQIFGGPESRKNPPKPGQNVVLTIDRDLQASAEASFDGFAGAVVALDPRNGEVLSLVSVPAFDPNLVSGLLGKEVKERLDADPLKPWMNRAISGQYAPGSTYKVVTGMAALAEHATSPKEKVRCPGAFRMGRSVWRCHKDSGHGQVDLRDAYKVSCDVYFYTMGARVGIDRMAAMARALGFGKRTGIDLLNEKPGLVPDTAFHDRVDRATGGYQKGMAVNTAIGQGSVLVTPLQLALAYAALANGGTVFEPRIVGSIETADFRVTRRFLPRGRRIPDLPHLDVQEETFGKAPEVAEVKPTVVRSELGQPHEFLEVTRDGLFAVTNEPGGTAYWRRSRKVSMAGKTGTAQVMVLGRERLKPEDMEYMQRDHAWFVAYAPAENPEIVVVVVNEHSGHGGSHAAPIAVKVIDAWADLRSERLASVGLKEEEP